ncbi:GIY-YIG nuclease family protein [Candidatus Saccharibacteria bacterium]|nr:GIY-YIG nuclease family protein [Candidatus Saccharibacteria bacterium]
MFYVYLLQSLPKPRQLHVGYTPFLEDCIRQHNETNKGYASRFQPWKLIYYEAYEKRVWAIEREKQFRRHANVMIRLKSRLNLL